MLLAQVLLNSLVTGTQVLLLAAGLYLIYAVARCYHIALGAIATSSAYAFFTLFQAGLPSFVIFPLALLFGGLVGLISFFVLRKFIDAGQDLLALLVSLTFGVAIESILGIIYGPGGRFLSDSVLSTYHWGELYLTQVGVLTIVVGIVSSLAAYVFLYLLPWGRLIRAVSQHHECASIMGINAHRIRMVSFFVVGVIAACVGALSGLNSAVVPTAGLHPIIMAFVALLVGGVMDFRGTVVASYLVVLIPEMIVSLSAGSVNFSETWKLVFMFLLALFLLLLRPQGLFSKLNRET
jgi:branched-chain amino acid transport system permease protein